MYVLAPNQTVERFPYSIGELRRDNPGTSFPANPSEELLAEWNVFPVAEAAPQFDPATQSARRLDPVLVDGVWTDTWEVYDADPEDVAGLEKSMAAAARAERSKLLAESDWTQLADAPLSAEGIDAWSAYRQSLRDVPAQESFPWDIAWPDKPAA